MGFCVVKVYDSVTPNPEVPHLDPRKLSRVLYRVSVVDVEVSFVTSVVERVFLFT